MTEFLTSGLLLCYYWVKDLYFGSDGIVKKQMRFEDIKPYVRYAKILTCNSDYEINRTRAYDNRLIYFFEGAADVIIDDVSYIAERGSMFIWQSDNVYSIFAKETGFRALYVNFDYTYGSKNNSLAMPTVEMAKFNPSQRLEEVFFTDAPEFNSPMYFSDMRSIELDFHNLENEFVSPQKNYVMMLATLMQTVLIKTARRLISDSNGVNTSFLVGQVIEYIQENYAKNLTNADIGAAFSYHPNYINRSMLFSTGQSLHQYVISVRVLKALELIQTSDLTMTEIAKQVGFKSIKHFSQSFKKVYGFSPTHFKNKK